MSASIRGGVVALLIVASIGPAVRGQGGQSTAAAPGNQSLPGRGATSWEEVHGDWRVLCPEGSGRRVCALSQQQTDKDTRQLLLAIELMASATEGAEGTLVLPFGLALDRPVTLHVDDASSGATLHFRTCLPVGCLIGLAFDSTAIALLRHAASVRVRAIAQDGQGAAFSISLNGFSMALDRAVALSSNQQ